MIYFISDTHFFHKNILKHQDRPFDSVEDMNKSLIKNWNDKVKKNDEIFILGDFSFGKEEETLDLLDSLNGKKYLIRGNHDLIIKKDSVQAKFQWIKDYYVLKINKQKIILFHYPIYSWDTKYHGSIHLYGHTHGNETFNEPNSYNVCADVNNYTPISLNEILNSNS